MSERASLVIKAAASAILPETFLCTSVEIFFGHCSSPWYAMDRSSKQAHWHENAPLLPPPPFPRPHRLAEPALAGGPPWVRATPPTGKRPWRRGGARGKGRSRRRRSSDPTHYWLRCAAQQGSDSLLAPLCGAAGLRVTTGSAVRRCRASSHGWLRCAAQPRLAPLCGAAGRRLTAGSAVLG